MTVYLSRIVRALRKTNKLSQIDFANTLKMSQGTLSKVEAGLLDVPTETLAYLMQKFRIDHNTLYSGYVELNYVGSLKDTGFRLSPEYRTASKYSSRHVAVMRLAINQTFEEFDKMLSSNLKLDLDILSILNHPISAKMFNDIEEIVQARFYNKKYDIDELIKYDKSIIEERDSINFISSFASRSGQYFDSEIEIKTENEQEFVFDLISSNKTLHDCGKLAFKSVKGKLNLNIQKIEENKSRITYLVN